MRTPPHMVKILSIVGARPQFIKLAPICHAAVKYGKRLQHCIIHTGQHYDYNMSKIFFKELGIPDPDYHLNVGSASHGQQTGRMLERIEKILIKLRPDWVIVYGDTNSTLAGALAAKKLLIPVAHVEAGLRSYNCEMPEETNRIVTDHCSDILFCPTDTAIRNLEKEGFPHMINGGKLVLRRNRFGLNKTLPCVFNVGDIMYDALKTNLKIAEQKSHVLKELGLTSRAYYLATIHRAENTDNVKNLSNILIALCKISKNFPVIFPIHPRTRKQLHKFKIPPRLVDQIRLIEPISYFDMLLLEKNAKVILTDSGGIQKEAFFLQVPCITLRAETEWLETVKKRWNFIAGVDVTKIMQAVKFFTRRRHPPLASSPFGKGNSAETILRILLKIQSFNCKH